MHSEQHSNQLHDPQALAELAGKTMYERDPASQALGMTLDAIRPGYARMSMRVRADMLNGHATCHGGFIFMLADSAFAFACNSHNFNTVGAGCSIDYLAPGREGDRRGGDQRAHPEHREQGVAQAAERAAQAEHHALPAALGHAQAQHHQVVGAG